MAMVCVDGMAMGLQLRSAFISLGDGRGLRLGVRCEALERNFGFSFLGTELCIACSGWFRLNDESQQQLRLSPFVLLSLQASFCRLLKNVLIRTVNSNLTGHIVI